MFRTWLESQIPVVHRTTPSRGRTLYHGTILANYLKIVSEGKIRSWGSDNQGIEKASMGDMYETGLIWFFDEKDKDQAWSYAQGGEYRRRELEFAPGGIVEVDVPRNLKIVDRYHKLTQEQAEKLIPYYPAFAQSYKPIKAGLELGFAARRIWEYRSSDKKIGFGQVLKMLDLDGIVYEELQIAIAANELPIAAAYPVTNA